MFDRRAKNREIFQDTCRQIEESTRLQESIKNSIKNQQLYLQGKIYTYVMKRTRSNKMCDVIVSGKRTFEAAEGYVKAGKRVAVLNFASAINPGGGVVNGSSAQEESLCRCSTLYQCLDIDEMWSQFYEPHRAANNPLYNDDILVTPDVTVFKSDVDWPERLPEDDWYSVDVITCAAPNLRDQSSNEMNPFASNHAAELSRQDYIIIMRERIRQIFITAQTTGADVLILGAFGCGAFRNPPEVVAKLFKEAVDDFGPLFETIEFAVYHTPRKTNNYDSFVNAFNADNAYDLRRFVEEHYRHFDNALAEIKQGKKQSHWMWYIFPQIKGLGHSDISKYYAIKDLEEAKAYIQDPYLGGHMQEICEALLKVRSNIPENVMGYPDDLKLKSSMTLFAMVDPENQIYKRVLDKFFEGQMDDKTLRKIK